MNSSYRSQYWARALQLRFTHGLTVEVTGKHLAISEPVVFLNSLRINVARRGVRQVAVSTRDAITQEFWISQEM